MRQRQPLRQVSRVLRLPCFCYGARGTEPRARLAPVLLTLCPHLMPQAVRGPLDAPQLPRGRSAPSSPSPSCYSVLKTTWVTKKTVSTFLALSLQVKRYTKLMYNKCHELKNMGRG